MRRSAARCPVRCALGADGRQGKTHGGDRDRRVRRTHETARREERSRRSPRTEINSREPLLRAEGGKLSRTPGLIRTIARELAPACDVAGMSERSGSCGCRSRRPRGGQARGTGHRYRVRGVIRPCAQCATCWLWGLSDAGVFRPARAAGAGRAGSTSAVSARAASSHAEMSSPPAWTKLSQASARSRASSRTPVSARLRVDLDVYRAEASCGCDIPARIRSRRSSAPNLWTGVSSGVNALSLATIIDHLVEPMRCLRALLGTPPSRSFRTRAGPV
jgi:hypothetical protein